MKFYLQYGVPDTNSRVFLDDRLHNGARKMDEVEAADWKAARDLIGKLPAAPEAA